MSRTSTPWAASSGLTPLDPLGYLGGGSLSPKTVGESSQCALREVASLVTNALACSRLSSICPTHWGDEVRGGIGRGGVNVDVVLGWQWQ
jgi:hypothetical protein